MNQIEDEFFPYKNEPEKIVIPTNILKEGNTIQIVEETISDIESVPNKELNDNIKGVIVHKCVTCYFKRLAGSLTVGNWAKTYEVDTCALENAPLPPERTCGFWMSDS